MEHLRSPNQTVAAERPQVVDREPQGALRLWIFRLHPAVVIDVTLKTVLVLAFLGELGVVFFSVLSRSVFHGPLLWTDEAAQLALSTIAFLLTLA